MAGIGTAPLGFLANVAPGMKARVCVQMLGNSQLRLGGGEWERRMLNGDEQEGDEGPKLTNYSAVKCRGALRTEGTVPATLVEQLSSHHLSSHPFHRPFCAKEPHCHYLPPPPPVRSTVGGKMLPLSLWGSRASTIY